MDMLVEESELLSGAGQVDRDNDDTVGQGENRDFSVDNIVIFWSKSESELVSTHCKF